MAVRRGEAHPRHLAHVVDSVRERTGDPPEFAVLASAYTVEADQVTFKRSVDLLAIDRRRAEIGHEASGCLLLVRIEPIRGLTDVGRNGPPA